MMGTQGLDFIVNPRKLPSHACPTRLRPRVWRVNTKVEKKPAKCYLRSNVVIPGGSVTPVSSNTYAHSDASPIVRNTNITSIDFLPANSIPETYPKPVTIGVIFVPFCTYEPP